MSTSTAKRSNSSAQKGSAENLQEAREAAKKAYDNLIDATEKFKFAAMEAGVDVKEVASDKLDEKVESAQDKAFDSYEQAQNYIIDKPFTSAGIAFAAGFVISKLIAR